MPETYNDADYYGNDPWSGITTNERPWYDGLLRDMYMRSAVYSPLVRFKIDIPARGQKTAREIIFNDVIPPRPNIAPIGHRQMEASRIRPDSRQRSVVTER